MPSGEQHKVTFEYLGGQIYFSRHVSRIIIPGVAHVWSHWAVEQRAQRRGDGWAELMGKAGALTGATALPKEGLRETLWSSWPYSWDQDLALSAWPVFRFPRPHRFLATCFSLWPRVCLSSVPPPLSDLALFMSDRVSTGEAGCGWWMEVKLGHSV